MMNPPDAAAVKLMADGAAALDRALAISNRYGGPILGGPIPSHVRKIFGAAPPQQHWSEPLPDSDPIPTLEGDA